MSKSTIQTDICTKCIEENTVVFPVYAIVSVNKFATYVTNEVLISRHECGFERYTCELDYLKSWWATNFIRDNVPCIVKTCPLHILYSKKNLIVC